MHVTSFSVRLSVFYGAIFLIYGIHLPYYPIWLEQRGIDVEQIGWIIAAPLFLRVAMTPLLAGYADRTRTHKRWILTLATLSGLAVLILSQLHGLWPIALASLALAIAFSAMMPIAETIAISGVRTISLDYGRTRLWGSATFILASFAAGAIITRFGPDTTIWLLCAATLIALASATLLPAAFPPETKEPTAPGNEPKQTHQPRRVHALRSTLFITFLVCASLSQAAHATYYAFGTLQWLKQGISPFWIGSLWALGVIAEIALFSFSRAIVTRTGAVFLLIAGALAGVVRWMAMAFEPSLAALFPLQILHALTYGATHIGAIHFIARAVPQNLTATGQALYGAIGNGFALGGATVLAGWVMVTWGAPTAYMAMAAVSLIAAIAGVTIARQQAANSRLSTTAP